MHMQAPGDTALFPSSGMRVLSAFIHFAGVSILVHCLSRRVAAERLSSLAGLAQLSFARSLILLALLDSWLFLFTGGMVIFGAGLESSRAACSLGIYLCIIFYASSKALIYLFLVEKMHIVWAPIAGSRRIKSPVYLVTMIILIGYAAVIVLLFVGHIAKFRDDGVCVIGLHHIASIPLITYDLFTNILLTGLFLWPLWKSTQLNARVKRIATRTTIAALVALATSTGNMLVLTIMHGEQLGWVCLGACGADVIVNAVSLFWVSTGPKDDGRHHTDGLPPRRSLKSIGKLQSESVMVYRPPADAQGTRPRATAVDPNVREKRSSISSVFEHSKAAFRPSESSDATAPVTIPPMCKVSSAPSVPMAPQARMLAPEHHTPAIPSTPAMLSIPDSRPPGGMARLISLFRSTSEDRRAQEVQITVTRDLDVHTDFQVDEMEDVPSRSSRRSSRQLLTTGTAADAV